MTQSCLRQKSMLLYVEAAIFKPRASAYMAISDTALSLYVGDCFDTILIFVFVVMQLFAGLIYEGLDPSWRACHELCPERKMRPCSS